MPGRWEPSPEDTMSLAAFRWFANTIENFAIELYATDRGSFEEIETVLRTTLHELNGVRTRIKLSADSGCPDGFVMCEGMCAPSCDMEAEAASAAPPASGGKAEGNKR